MNNRFFLALMILTSLISCGKEDDTDISSEPIDVRQPSKNSSGSAINIVRGAPIRYDVRFSAGSQIDSVKLFYQIDSMGVGFQTGKKDSMVHYVDYPENEPKNQRAIEGSFLPHTFPSIGRKIYMHILLYPKGNFYEKQVPLIVN